MKIFPAIDVKDKKCVRLIKGNFDQKKVRKKSEKSQKNELKILENFLKWKL